MGRGGAREIECPDLDGLGKCEVSGSWRLEINQGVRIGGWGSRGWPRPTMARSRTAREASGVESESD